MPRRIAEVLFVKTSPCGIHQLNGRKGEEVQGEELRGDKKKRSDIYVDLFRNIPLSCTIITAHSPHFHFACDHVRSVAVSFIVKRMLVHVTCKHNTYIYFSVYATCECLWCHAKKRDVRWSHM